jgi:GxxExxY protein
MGTTEGAEDTERVEPRPGLPELAHEKLTGEIRQTAFDVHRYLGNGFLEKVYENALAHRLGKRGHDVAGQAALSVRDEDGTVVGHYVADLVVDGTVLVEIKAVRGLTAEHYAQILNYLKATGLRIGLLLNFGRRRLEVKRFTM